MTTHKRPSAGLVAPGPTIRRPVRVRPRAAFDPFLALLQAHGLPVPQTEFLFHPTRKWRADYCWPAAMLILEMEGGLWTRGRHTRPLGFEHDCVKYAEAALAGWTVLRASPRQMTNGTVIDWLKRAF